MKTIPNQVTVVMYHHVLDFKNSKFPNLKGLETALFKEQIEYLLKYYRIISIEELINSIYSNTPIPANSALLTFDDGYIEHFDTVFPILTEKKFQGSFYIPAKAISENEVLDVNKIHILLASVPDVQTLIEAIYACLDEIRGACNLESNEHYFAKLAVQSRFDTKEVIFVKRLLQRELAEVPRKLILDKLFSKFVTIDEKSFSREMYMDMEQIKCMSRNGMHIGSHGHDHFFLGELSPSEQEKEIDFSINFLSNIGSPGIMDNLTMCYPFGDYNESLITILKKKNYKLGFTTKVDIATASLANAMTLERLDTNDLPKDRNEEPNSWTRKAMSGPVK
jgi:peptidoglycan/xylan/chitin deacetylase (PgdA/CDA1 family)